MNLSYLCINLFSLFVCLLVNEGHHVLDLKQASLTVTNKQRSHHYILTLCSSEAVGQVAINKCIQMTGINYNRKICDDHKNRIWLNFILGLELPIGAAVIVIMNRANETCGCVTQHFIHTYILFSSCSRLKAC